MTTGEATTTKPLWLSIEEGLLEIDAQVLSGEGLESTIQQMAGKLDESGYNVSKHGGNLLQLRWAVDDMRSVGHPMMTDINTPMYSNTPMITG